MRWKGEKLGLGPLVSTEPQDVRRQCGNSLSDWLASVSWRRVRLFIDAIKRKVEVEVELWNEARGCNDEGVHSRLPLKLQLATLFNFHSIPHNAGALFQKALHYSLV
jgi:hypothetical protein